MWINEIKKIEIKNKLIILTTYLKLNIILSNNIKLFYQIYIGDVFFVWIFVKNKLFSEFRLFVFLFFHNSL